MRASNQMTDDIANRRQFSRSVEGKDVQPIVRSVLATVARGDVRMVVQQKRFLLFADAFLESDGALYHAAIDRALAFGLSPLQVIDELIPATARLMGDRWFADEISFADVTISTARLQEAVRALAAQDRANGRRRPLSMTAPEILIILPPGEEHSLGLFVAMDQFRRLGYRVTAAVDQPSSQIIEMIQTGAFAMIGLTVSRRRTLVSTKVLVEKIRKAVPDVAPIVVGGSCLDLGVDVLKETGADLIARDAKTALDLCGLSVLFKEEASGAGFGPISGRNGVAWEGKHR